MLGIILKVSISGTVKMKSQGSELVATHASRVGFPAVHSVSAGTF